MSDRGNSEEDPAKAESEQAEADSNRPSHDKSPGEDETQSQGGSQQSTDPSEQGAPEEGVPLADLAEELPADQRGTRATDQAPDSQEEDPSSEEMRSDEGAPFEEMAGDMRKRRTRREEDPESSPFEAMDVGEVDGEAVWEELLTEEEMSEAERAVGAGVSATEVGSASAGERTEHIVPKDQFCSRCPYLADPPGLACEHEGTEIVEVTDAEQFRVRGCPFAGREADELTDFE